MSDKYEMKSVPEMSYGNHLEDDTLVVIKVNSGDYAGTVFNYVNVKVEENTDNSGDMTYTCEFHTFVHSGTIYETEPTDSDVLNNFYKTVSSPFLYNVVVSTAQHASQVEESAA